MYGSRDTVTRLKTTIELPDQLARQARALAHEQGTTLRELVVEGLRTEVARRADAPRVDFHFPAFGGGGLQAGIDHRRLLDHAYDEHA